MFHPYPPVPDGEVLDSASHGPGPGTGRRRVAVAGAAAAVAVLGGAAVAAAAFLSGGGTQPEELLPAGVVVYADLDLDPAAGQKANIARFLRSFDGLDTRLGAEEGWRPAVLERLLDLSKGDTAQVDGWLGDRYGVAVLGVDGNDLLGGQPPPVVVAVQVSDADAAVRWIDARLDGNGSTLAVADYVLVGDEGVDLQQVVDDAAAGSLADSADFRAAMDPLGDGVASVYVDLPALQALAGAAALVTGGGLPDLAGAGPAGYVLRVEPSALEVEGGFAMAAGTVADEGTQLAAGLPASTAALLSVSGLGQTVADQWDALADQLSAGMSSRQLQRELRALEGSTGLVLPDDLTTLLGDDLALAVDSSELAISPSYGIRVVSDPAAAASLVDRLRPAVARTTGGYGLDVTATADGWVLASDPGYAARLAADDGGFGDQPQVQAALPGLGAAAYVGYVDLDAVVDLVAQAGGDDAVALLTPLRAAGLTATRDGDHVSVTARLTLDG